MQKSYIAKAKKFKKKKYQSEFYKTNLSIEKNKIKKYIKQHQKLKEKYLTLEVYSSGLNKSTKLNTKKNISPYINTTTYAEAEKDILKHIDQYIYFILVLLSIIFLYYYNISYFTKDKPLLVSEKTTISKSDELNTISTQTSINSKQLEETNIELKQSIFENSQLAKKIFTINYLDNKEGFYVVLGSCSTLKEAKYYNKKIPDCTIISNDDKHRLVLAIPYNSDNEIQKELKQIRKKHKLAWLLFNKH